MLKAIYGAGNISSRVVATVYSENFIKELFTLWINGWPIFLEQVQKFGA